MFEITNLQNNVEENRYKSLKLGQKCIIFSF